MQKLESKKQVFLLGVKKNPNIVLENLLRYLDHYEDLHVEDFRGYVSEDLYKELTNARQKSDVLKEWEEVRRSGDIFKVAEFRNNHPDSPLISEVNI